MTDRSPLEGEMAPRIYQVLLLTRDGEVVRTQHLAACNDGQALRLVKGMMNGHAVDLWDGLRFMEHFAPEEPR